MLFIGKSLSTPKGFLAMMNSTSRRTFLGTVAMCAAGGILQACPSTSHAIEPIKRPGTPNFKFSLAAYSYRDLLSGEAPELTLHDFIDQCASMGLHGTELTSYYFPANPSAEYLHELHAHAFKLGLDVSGTAVGNDFCHPPGPKRDQQISLVKRWIEHAAMLNAPVIRIFSGKPQGGQTVAQAHHLAVEGMEECCDYAGQHGVFLALENHGGLTSKVEGMLSLIRDVKSPWFGVNLDSGNFHGEDIYDDLAKIAPFALNVQVKVVVSPAGGGKQPSDFGRLASILKDAGYRGYIVLEYEESEDPRVACPRYVALLREAFA